MRYTFATLVMLGLLGGTSMPAHAGNSHVEALLAGQGYISVFNRALHRTGVINELDENRAYTLFVPTNAAFRELVSCAYHCHRSVQCRAEVAAMLRNHIVPMDKSIDRFSKWGGGIPTLGTRPIEVAETFYNDYTVEGHKVLYERRGNNVSVYPIDGVIISDQELARIRTYAGTDNRDVVRDARGQIVHNTYGNCVRTHWRADRDPCAAQYRYAPGYRQEMRPSAMLTQEERTVYFEFDRATLLPEAKARLNTLANVLKSDQSVKQARVVGFADRLGSASYNEQLSRRRAEAVRDYLIANGYTNASVTETHWVGESEPSTDCPTEARAEMIVCLQKDRRVEVRMEYFPEAQTPDAR